jgi:hypothetical protein
MAELSPCTLVCVPGQKMWHTHTCPSCGSSWTHIAPTPMTVEINERIHTCTKCGTRVWTFEKLQIGAGNPYGWIAGGALAGLLLAAALLDRD